MKVRGHIFWKDDPSMIITITTNRDMINISNTIVVTNPKVVNQDVLI